jgi:hypothetical protein
LGSVDEVLNSSFGPDFLIREESGDVLFPEGVFGGGLATTGGTANTGPGGGYLAMSPDDFFPADKTRGTVEMWVQKRLPVLIPFQTPLVTLFGRQGYGPGYLSISASWTDATPNSINFGVYAGEGQGHGAQDYGWAEVPAGQWVHMAFVWDGAGIEGGADSVRIYRDGEVVASHQGRFSEVVPLCCTGYDCGEELCPAGYEVRVLANHEGRRLRGCSQYPSGYCPAAFIDNIIVWDRALTDFSHRFAEDPGAPTDRCDLDIDLSYADNTLEVDFEVGTTRGARWKIYLVRYGVTELLVADRVVVDPPISLTISVPEFESRGTIGFLTTLATREDVIICSDFETVDTGQPDGLSVPEHANSTGEELKWIFAQKLNDTLFEYPENVRYEVE